MKTQAPLMVQVLLRYWDSWELERARQLPTLLERRKYLRQQAVQAARGSTGPGQIQVDTRLGHIKVWKSETRNAWPHPDTPEWAETYQARMASPDGDWTIERFVDETLAYYGLKSDAAQQRLPGFS